MQLGWMRIATLLAVAAVTPPPGPNFVRVPMICSPGQSQQIFQVAVRFPEAVAPGSTFTVRIDGAPSGEVAHVGLMSIHGMETDYALPSEVTYVAGSARIIPGTGTSNVKGGARVWHEGGMIRMVLPSRIKAGSRYTPPSIEFQLQASNATGIPLVLTFVGYQVTVSAFVLGDVQTRCDPKPQPFALATAVIRAP